MDIKSYLNDESLLNEKSLGRIYQHITKTNVKSWAILTSWRGENSPAENKKDFLDLKKRIRSLGYGFIEIKGVGQEEDDEGNVIPVSEPSIFIPDIDRSDAHGLSIRYNQWGYIYSGPEVNDKIALISKDGVEYLGSFHPNKMAKFFSKVKNKPFTFEGTEPTSYMERYWKYLVGNK